MKGYPVSVYSTALIGLGGCGANMLADWLPHLPAQLRCLIMDRAEEMPYAPKPVHALSLPGIRSVHATVEYMHSVQAEVQASLDARLTDIEAILQGYERVVLLAGLGGVVGSHATLWLAAHLLATGRHVAACLVMPFTFERETMLVAERIRERIHPDVRTIFCLNDELYRHLPPGTSMTAAFRHMNRQACSLFLSW